MKWSAYLYATLADSDFLKLTPETVSDLGHRMYILPLSTERAGHGARTLEFIFRNGDKIAVGRQGKVGDVLGMEHPFAWEISAVGTRGRESQYTLAFVAGADAPVPSRTRIDEAIRTDLVTLLERAHTGEREIEISRTFAKERSLKTSKGWRKAYEQVAQRGGVQLFLSGEPVTASADFGAGSSHITEVERATLNRAGKSVARSEDREGGGHETPVAGPASKRNFPAPDVETLHRPSGGLRLPEFRLPWFTPLERKPDFSDGVRTLFIQGVPVDEAAFRLGAPMQDVMALYRRLEGLQEIR